MNGVLDWNVMYLVCFAVGLTLTVLSFVTGFGHFHLGHMHIGHVHRSVSITMKEA